jgi:hypothetical protein
VHAALDDRVLDAEELGDAGLHGAMFLDGGPLRSGDGDGFGVIGRHVSDPAPGPTSLVTKPIPNRSEFG